MTESEEEKKVPSNKENLPQWTEELHDIHPPVCDATPAVLLPRVNLPLQLDYLQCFMNQVVIDSFVTNTNLYAISRQAVDWVPVTTEEMWRYLAIRIRQGIVVLPDLHYYWQAGYRDSYCAALMSRNRFCQLHRYFHIAPPVPRGQRQTVVEKTHLFYHQCQALFLKFYEPGSNMALDETMIRFQGRSPWITIIKSKPEPVGYKMFTVASDGYLLGFRIYRGKGGYNTSQNVLHHTVVDLVKPWAERHRTLYFDNLFTSPGLCDHLLRLKIRSCGTCRPNRSGLPPNLKQTKAQLPKDGKRTWQRGQLGCLMWYDAKPVLFLTTHLRPDRLTPLLPSAGHPATSRPPSQWTTTSTRATSIKSTRYVLTM